MKKGSKIIGILIVILFILAVCGAIYVSVKPEETSIQPSNKLLEETSNIINDIEENVTVNETITNEVINEVSEENQSNKDEETTSEQENNTQESETVEGTVTSREDKAVELAKKYYEEEYGSIEGIYFRYDSINGDGRYRVVAGSAGSVNNMFFLVDLDTETVTKK